ncbi:MAG: MOSC domain-containing protein [Ktedonobacterales bacterium]
MQQVGLLESVQIGTPHRYASDVHGAIGHPWHTSFVRVPSDEPRWLFTTHLEGNQQADRKNHGSLDQAVLLYAAAHYPIWRTQLGRGEIGPGGFGENFTVSGQTEMEVCVGDTYAIAASDSSDGTDNDQPAQVQVTGPRYPCWKIERRWQTPGLTACVAKTGRTGWYCRVLREGRVIPGAPLLLVARPYPHLSVALVNAFAHHTNPASDLATAQAILDCELINDWWQAMAQRRLRGQE